MDLTELATDTLERVPANRLFGLRVQHASSAAGEVVLDVHAEHGNVIGSLHASGLIALLDAAGLAAILGAAPSSAAVAGVGALGARADVRFVAPAHGRLLARCCLDEQAAAALAGLYDGSTHRSRITTRAQITDADSTLVCEGGFEWSLRRSV